MRLKIDFGKGGLKGFIAQHAEKAILGLVLALVGVFIYTSATQEVDETGSPEDLKTDAGGARSALAVDHWGEIREERVAAIGDTNFAERAKQAGRDIEDAAYRLASTWDKPDFAPRANREDPKMFRPEEVEASGGVFNIAMRTSSRVDPWIDDKDAVVKPQEEDKPKKRPKRKSRRRTSEGSDGDMLYGSGGYYDEMESGSEYGSSEEEGSSSSMMSTAAAGARKAVGQTWKDLYDKGFEGSFAQASQGVIGRSVAAVSVKALVPFEKQWDEHERALGGRTGYSAQQDIPRYLWFEAQRAEVPDDPNAPLQWKTISRSDYAMKVSRLYAAFPEEIADPAYIFPGILTMPIPPIMLKSFDELALHSEIPRHQVKPVETADKEGLPDEPPLDLNEEDLSQPVQGIPKVGTGMGGGGSDPGSGYSSSPYGGEASGSYTDPYGGGSGYGTGSDYGDPNSTGQEQLLVKYKMVRFFDLKAELGKSYRYRVAVVLEDPNYSRNPQASPDARILDPDAAKRVKAKKAKDEAETKRTGEWTRTYYLRTDWSEPSNIVTIAKPEKYVAGSVTKGKVIPLTQDIKVQTTESAGKLVTMVWNNSRAVEVPAEKEVYRGSFLSFTQDADVLNPLTKQVKTIEGYEFGTDAFVADLRGGEELITDVDEEDDDEKTVHYTPGEFLVIDGQGNLLACNEIDDTEEYRRLMFVEEEMSQAAASGYGGDMMDYGSSYEDMGSSGGEHGE